MTLKATTPGTRRFYGWYALAGAMIAGFIDTGAFGYSYGIFLPVICSEFGWSRAEVSVGMTLGLAFFGLPSPLIGLLVAKFGPRLNFIFGNLLAALGLAGMFLVQEVWHAYVFYSLAGLGAGIGGYISATATVNNWFIRKRSLATGIFFSATSLSGFIFAPLVTLLIASIGWRMSWLVLGGIVFIGASLIAGVVLVRDRPEVMGQVPDGIPAEPESETVATSSYLTGKSLKDWSMRQALRQPATWLIGIFSAANHFGFNAMIGHQVAYMQDLGFTPVTASLALSLISGMGILGSLGFGIIALRVNMKNLASAFFIIRLISMGLLLTTNNLALIYIYAVLFGISNGAILTAMPTMLGAYYGRTHFSQILGVMFTLQIFGGALGPSVTGAIYDATTSYTSAFVLITILSLAGLVCAFLARQPKLPSTVG